VACVFLVPRSPPASLRHACICATRCLRLRCGPSIRACADTPPPSSRVVVAQGPLSEDEIGLHCLLGRYPNAAPLLGADPFDANSAEGRNPLYRIANRQEPDTAEPVRHFASWMMA
jgi:hypothetical protein